MIVQITVARLLLIAMPTAMHRYVTGLATTNQSWHKLYTKLHISDIHHIIICDLFSYIVTLSKQSLVIIPLSLINKEIFQK